MELQQIIDCSTGEIKNINKETGEVVEIIQEARQEEQPTGEEE